MLQALANLVQQQEVMLQQLQQLNMAAPTQQQQQQQQVPADVTAYPAAGAARKDNSTYVGINGSSGSSGSSKNVQPHVAAACRTGGTFKSPFMLRQDELEQLLNRSSTSDNYNSSSHPDAAATGVERNNNSSNDARRWQSPFNRPSSAAAGAGVGPAQQQQQQQQQLAEQQPGYAFQLLQQATADQWERVASMTAVVSTGSLLDCYRVPLQDSVIGPPVMP
jgi:hypothetical protein